MAAERTRANADAAAGRRGHRDRGLRQAPSQAGVRRTLLPVLALLLIVTAIVYSASFANLFLNWDDPANVTQNPHIRAITWETIKLYFTTPLLGMYSPLVYFSYAIDFRIGGLEPGVYHATNLFLHLLSVCLVFVLVRRLTRNLAMATIVAALFAVHPMNVAAVTPVSVRSALLFSAFYLAALVAYVQYVEKDRRAYLWLSFVMFVAAVLSKSAAVVFPALMLLVDHYYEKPLSWKDVIRKSPFLLVSLVFGVVTFLFREDTLAMARAPQFSLVGRLFLACYSLVLYMFRLIVPVGLSSYYPYPDTIAGHLPVGAYLAPLVLAAAAWLAARLKRYRKAVVFGAGFFLIHLFLVLKIVPLGAEWTSDRYVYLPSIGLFFIAADMWRQRWRASPAWGAVLVIVVTVLGVVAYERNGAWKDNMTFYGEILRRYPDAAIAWSNRGAARLRDLNDAAGAAADCDHAVRLDPGYADAYYNRATAKVVLRQYDGALRDSDAAVRLNGRRSEYFQLRADIKLALKDYRGAIGDTETAIGLSPGGPEAYMAYASRGIARIWLQDGAGAIEDFNESVRLNPYEAAVYQNRANARAMLGNDKGAMADYDKAIEVDRSFATAYYYRGLLRQKLADSTGSCEDFRKASSLGLDTARTLATRDCK